MNKIVNEVTFKVLCKDLDDEFNWIKTKPKSINEELDVAHQLNEMTPIFTMTQTIKNYLP